MKCGEEVLGMEIFDRLSEMFVLQDITYEEYDEACCNSDYAKELIELHYMVPSSNG